MSEFDRVTKEQAVVLFTGNNTLLAQASAVIDTHDFGSVTYHVTAGAIAAGTITLTIEQSEFADGSTATAVPAAELINPDGSTGAAFSFDGAGSTAVQAIGDVGKQRFRIVSIVEDGGTGPIAGSVVLAHARQAPTE